MIRELHLHDFRGFSHFRLGKLGRVNLLVGRNNSGKTSILEALELLLAHGDPRAIWASLSRRGERVSVEDDQGGIGNEFYVSHLFHGHAPQIGSGFAIFSKNDHASQKLTGRIRELREEDKVQGPLPNMVFDLGPGMHLQWKSMNQVEETSIPLTDRLGVSVDFFRKRVPRPTENRLSATFVTTDSLGVEEVVSALSAVILDPEEEFVLQALQIIDPTIERIAPIVSSRSSRRGGVVIKSRNASGRLPIGTMGDGIWRLLALSLSLVRARGGVLMIDEIDTGLHYSALEDMWRLVGLTAKRLGIQVFATTHSSDCWKALAAVCADLGSGQEDATIHRIERDKTESVPFTEAEMIIAARSDLEIR